MEPTPEPKSESNELLAMIRSIPAESGRDKAKELGILALMHRIIVRTKQKTAAKNMRFDSAFLEDVRKSSAQSWNKETAAMLAELLVICREKDYKPLLEKFLEITGLRLTVEETRPEQYEAIIESSAFVNHRRLDVGQRAILALSFWEDAEISATHWPRTST